MSKEEILEKAIGAFARDGFDAMSMRELNRTLGVSHNWLHHHFETKQKLWEESIDYAFGTLQKKLTKVIKTMPNPKSPLERLKNIIVTFVTVASRSPSAISIILQEASSDGPRLNYILDKYFVSMIRTGRPLFDAAIHAQLLKPLPWRSTIIGTLTGAASVYALSPLVKRLGGGDPLTPEAIEEHAEAVAEIVLHGVTMRSPQEAPADH